MSVSMPVVVHMRACVQQMMKPAVYGANVRWDDLFFTFCLLTFRHESSALSFIDNDVESTIRIQYAARGCGVLEGCITAHDCSNSWKLDAYNSCNQHYGQTASLKLWMIKQMTVSDKVCRWEQRCALCVFHRNLTWDLSTRLNPSYTTTKPHFCPRSPETPLWPPYVRLWYTFMGKLVTSLTYSTCTENMQVNDVQANNPDLQAYRRCEIHRLGSSEEN
jgi:hypothetical protein